MWLAEMPAVEVSAKLPPQQYLALVIARVTQQ
jgi:hypothetical protein